MWHDVVRSLALLTLAVSPGLARVIHIPGEYPTIQQGIDAAVSGDIVLAAPGHYLEEINLKAGVVVQGAGEGLSVIDGGGNSGDVVRAIGNGIQGSTKLQGFTVTGAISGGSLPGGAGLFCNSGASPDIGNCRFEGNDFGIATWNSSNPVIHNNVVCHNTFFGVDISSNPTVINNTIAFNVIGIDDGGGYGPVVMNNIITDNSRFGVYAVGLQPVLTYNDVWGNDTNYKNCSPGTGCISADPMYADTATRDYHLKTGSPCINAGNPASQYNDPDGSRNDIGAYGGPGAPAPGPRVTTLVPGMNELDVAPAVDVLAGFNVAMNPATLNTGTFLCAGAFSGSRRATVSYDSAARLATLNPNHDFLVGEEVTAELTHDVVSAAGDSFPGFAWQFRVAAPAGSGRFSNTAMIPAGDSVVWIATSDFNQDRKLDLAAIRRMAGDISVYLGNGDGTFQTPILTPLGTEPSVVCVGDFNGDSIPDLAATFWWDTVAVFLGTGDGHFVQSSGYSCGYSVCEVATADLNLDGKSDLAVVDAEMDIVNILLGHGDGTFDDPVQYSVGGSPNTITIADLNRDGFPDFVTANPMSADLSVRLGNGDGTFDTLGEFACGEQPFFVRLGDFNEDGIPDAAVNDYTRDTVRVLLGTGTGAFAPAVGYPVGSYPFGILVSDLNADGHLDLSVTDRAGDVATLLGQGNGHFADAVNWPTVTDPITLCGGDFDQDGDIDLAVAGFGGEAVCIMPNDNGLEVESTAPARYALSAPVATSVSATFDQLLDPATLDSASFRVYGLLSGLHRGAIAWDSVTRTAALDPARDFACGEPVSAVLTKRIESRSGVRLAGYNWLFTTAIGTGSNGTFLPAVTYLTGTEPRGLCVADFDQDQDIDLVATINSPAAIAVLKNNGDGTFAAPVLANVNGDPIAVIGRDLDSDGDIDLAVFHNEPGSSHLEILKNMGAGNFTTYATYAPAILGQDIAAADFDSDGDVDLVLTDGWGSGTNVRVMMNNGSGGFTGPTNYSAGTWARGVATPDVDNDGAPDIVVVNSGNNSVSVLLNNGSGTFGVPADYATANGPNAVFAWDFNGDGWVDLATTHPGAYVISVLLNLGNGTFGAPVNQLCGMGQNSLTSGDFDGDGDIDLAASGYGIMDSCVVLLNNGAGAFPDRTAYHVGSTPWGIGCADFNLDGALDLAVAGYGDNNVSVLLATGLGITHAPTPAPQSRFTIFPNPCRDKLVILIPKSPTPDPHSLVSIHDASGRLIRSLHLSPSLPPALPSSLSWDCRDNSGNRVSPGIYFVSLSNRSSSFTNRNSLKVILTR